MFLDLIPITGIPAGSKFDTVMLWTLFNKPWSMLQCLWASPNARISLPVQPGLVLPTFKSDPTVSVPIPTRVS